MSRHRIRSGLLLVAAVFLLIGAAACTVPLAPGYRISKESREIQFVSGAPPELRIHGRFTVVNSGSAPLKFIDVVVPVEKTFGLRELRVQVDGRDATAAPLPAELQHDHPNTLRIAFDSTWEQKQQHELSIEYSLRSPADSGSRITLGAKTFSLGFRGWFVVLEPPDHALSPFPKRPDRTLVTIRVPSSFRVLSRGKRTGVKKQGRESEYRYVVRTKELAPFVVAGEYTSAQSSRGDSDSVTFWTLEPLKEDTAASAQRISSAWKTMETDFGPIEKRSRAPVVAESPEVRSRFSGETGPAAASFPGGALANPAAFALGINSDEFFRRVTHALARNWFGEQIYPAPFAELGLGEGLPEYATIVIDEASGGEAARARRVAGFLRAYDEASAKAVEIPLGAAKMTDPLEQRAISLAKAPLFFVALEDRCGETPVRAGLARVVSLLRGQEVGYNEIRSAIEESSKQDLAEFFRTWLYEKGIPKEFRAKYGAATVSQR